MMVYVRSVEGTFSLVNLDYVVTVRPILFVEDQVEILFLGGNGPVLSVDAWGTVEEFSELLRMCKERPEIAFFGRARKLVDLESSSGLSGGN